jgi:hypothetical protein
LGCALRGFGGASLGQVPTVASVFVTPLKSSEPALLQSNHGAIPLPVISDPVRTVHRFERVSLGEGERRH